MLLYCTRRETHDSILKIHALQFPQKPQHTLCGTFFHEHKYFSDSSPQIIAGVSFIEILNFFIFRLFSPDKYLFSHPGSLATIAATSDSLNITWKI